MNLNQTNITRDDNLISYADGLILTKDLDAIEPLVKSIKEEMLSEGFEKQDVFEYLVSKIAEILE